MCQNSISSKPLSNNSDRLHKTFASKLLDPNLHWQPEWRSANKVPEVSEYLHIQVRNRSHQVIKLFGCWHRWRPSKFKQICKCLAQLTTATILRQIVEPEKDPMLLIKRCTHFSQLPKTLVHFVQPTSTFQINLYYCVILLMHLLTSWWNIISSKAAKNHAKHLSFNTSLVSLSFE